MAPVAPRPAPPALIGCPPPIRQLPSRPIPPQIRWPCNGTPEVFMTPRFFVHFVHFVALARSRAILAEVLAQFRDVCLRQSRADRGGWAVISSQSAGARPEHSTTNPDTIKEPGSPRRVRLGGFRNPRLSRREPRPHALRPLGRLLFVRRSFQAISARATGRSGACWGWTTSTSYSTSTTRPGVRLGRRSRGSSPGRNRLVHSNGRGPPLSVSAAAVERDGGYDRRASGGSPVDGAPIVGPEPTITT